MFCLTNVIYVNTGKKEVTHFEKRIRSCAKNKKDRLTMSMFRGRQSYKFQFEIVHVHIQTPTDI